MSTKIDEEDKHILKIMTILGASGIVFMLFATMVVCGISRKEKIEDDKILKQSIGRTIESYTRDHNVIHFHYENGGGFSVRGHKGMFVE